MNIATIVAIIAQLKALAPPTLKAIIALCDYIAANPWASKLVPDSIEQHLPAVKAAAEFLLHAAGNDELIANAGPALAAMQSLSIPAQN